MDGREGASSGGSESASLQSQLQVESPNVRGSSGIEDASCDDDNQRALASLGIGDAVHTDATTAAAINAVDSHANEEATGGWASDGRTKLTTTLEKVAQEVHISQTPLSSEQHDIGEKSSQDLHGGSARIQPMEKDPCHDELTLQTAGVFPSESCDGDILEDKSETDNLTKNTREDTEMLEQQNSDKANIQVSCANKMSEVLYDDNNTLGKNTICGGKVTVECHLALLHNKSSEARSNAISSPMQKRPFACQSHVNGCTMSYDSKNNLAKPFREVHEPKKRFARRFAGCREEFSSKNERKIHEGSSAHVEVNTKQPSHTT